MSQDLEAFLRDTGIFLNDESRETLSPRSLDEAVNQIHQAVQDLKGYILDVEYGCPVGFYPGTQVTQLRLGKLRHYVFPSDPVELAQVAERLRSLAHSERLLRAILGYWPA